jgi:hypothetical protein
MNMRQEEPVIPDWITDIDFILLGIYGFGFATLFLMFNFFSMLISQLEFTTTFQTFVQWFAVVIVPVILTIFLVLIFLNRFIILTTYSLKNIKGKKVAYREPNRILIFAAINTAMILLIGKKKFPYIETFESKMK